MNVNQPALRIECPLACGNQAILRDFYYTCLNKIDPATGKRPHDNTVVAFVAGRCIGEVKDDWWISFLPIYCGKRATHEEDGKWYCGIHSPARIQQREQQREARRQEKARLRNGWVSYEYAQKEARDAIVQAAIAWAGHPTDPVLALDLSRAVERLAGIKASV